jgi:hypothetical protein
VEHVPDESADAVEHVPHPDHELSEEEWRKRIREWWHADISSDLWDQAVEWLKDKWGEDATCPFCDAKEWKVATRLAEQTTWATVGVQPVLPVVCGNCGYTVYIDGGIAGLVLPEKEEPEP